MDVGANDLFTVAGKLDDKLPTPVPLKIVADGSCLPAVFRPEVGQPEGWVIRQPSEPVVGAAPLTVEMPARLRSAAWQGYCGVVIGFAGIRRIGPHCLINHSSSFLQVHVQAASGKVHSLLQAGVTSDKHRWLNFTLMSGFQTAIQALRSPSFIVRCIDLSLEFTQEALTFFFRAASSGAGTTDSGRRTLNSLLQAWAEPVPRSYTRGTLTDRRRNRSCTLCRADRTRRAGGRVAPRPEDSLPRHDGTQCRWEE